MAMRDCWSVIKDRIERYSNVGDARDWLNQNFTRVSALFSNYSLREFVFEPFKGVFQTPDNTIDSDIYSVITQVAIINAVLAGLPGRMGVGVFVSMALEGWMAYSIARHIGIKIDKPSDIWKYFGLLATSAAIILYLFRILLGVAFSLFSLIPGVNPLILAEIFVTDLVGVLFWVGFQEVLSDKPFNIPKRLVPSVQTRTMGIFKHQLSLIKNVLSIENIQRVGRRLAAYLKGDFPVDMRLINGEVFATAAMAYLISGQHERLEGPLGETFLQAIRMRWSEQLGANAPVEKIATRFQEYDTEQLQGAISTIKGKMFEILVAEQENLDSDQWSAKMHTDESFPGSDIVFFNSDTRQQVEVSLKAVADDQTEVIENALARYPDTPILTTDEAAALFENHDMVFASGFANDELQDITEERLDELISRIEPLNESEVVIGGVTVGTTAALWPFVVAYLKKQITQEQLQRVFNHVLGQAGVMLASRIVYGVVFGPLFAWYLLARGVQGLVVMAEPGQYDYIEFVGKAPESKDDIIEGCAATEQEGRIRRVGRGGTANHRRTSYCSE